MAEEKARLNVTDRVTAMAKAMPEAIALVEPLGYDQEGKRGYRQITFRELEDDSSRIARGLRRLAGVLEDHRRDRAHWKRRGAVVIAARYLRRGLDHRDGLVLHSAPVASRRADDCP